MRRMILLVAMTVLAAGAAFAHGKVQHIMGKVTAMTDTSITVQTKAKNPVTVYTVPETKYAKGGAAASMKDLKVGDRVVIHAGKMGDKLMANEVRFGVVAKTPHQP
jgi:preprotein translocase subunit YajC